VIAIGLTGGIGSGKSTVARMLAELGATVVDADRIARDVVEAGSPAMNEIAARFGEAVVRLDGSLDRLALAEIVFADPAARRDLNSIVHPRVEREVLALLASEQATDHVVVVEVPLLAETGRERYPLAGVLVVDAPPDLAEERLVRDRSLSIPQAKARIGAQAAREERFRMADFIIMNMGTLEELTEMARRAWHWMLERREECSGAAL
jgi:dephospho-CoA kinase